MNLRIAVLFILIATYLSSCVKAPSYPIEPQIEFKSVATTTSVIYLSGGNPIYIPDTITVSFTDGDGDLNYYDNPADSLLCIDNCAYADGDSSCLNISSKNVFVVDSRDTCLTTYNTAYLEPEGKFQSLSGEIMILHKIFLKQCLVPSVSCAKETVRFKIRIKDRAGHRSNEIETPPITVEVKNL